MRTTIRLLYVSTKEFFYRRIFLEHISPISQMLRTLKTNTWNLFYENEEILQYKNNFHLPNPS